MAKPFNLSTIAICILAISHLSNSNAQTAIPQASPYSSDEHTVLLEHFDGSTTGSPTGAIQYTNAIFGQGVHMNNASWLAWSGLGDFPKGTIEFWGKLDNLTNAVGVPDFVWAYLSPSQIGGGPGSTLIVNVVGSDSPGFHAGMPTAGVHNGGSWLHTPTNSLSINAGRWYHYALTWGDNGLHFYVDGVLIGTNAPGRLNPSTSVWVLGNANGHGFNGAIDELRISNIQRVFTTAPALTIEPAAYRLRWLAESNVTYDVHWSTNAQDWSALTSIVGSGSETNIVDWADGPKRFYRLIKN